MCVPSVFFIGEAGMPLEVTGGNVSPEEFEKKIEMVLKVIITFQFLCPGPKNIYFKLSMKKL